MKIFKILKRIGNKPIFPNSNETVETEGYSVERNQWGSWKLKKWDYPTTIYVSEKSIKFFGPLFNRGVLAYPRFKTKGLAGLVDKSKKLIADVDFKIKTKGIKHNVCYDIWFNTTPNFSFSSVKHEIMITESSRGFKPSGKKTYRGVVINGKMYDVYSGKIDKSKESLGVDGWHLTTFVCKNKLFNIENNLKNYFNFVDGLDNLYMSEIEFGTEVFNDEGELVINKFEIRYDN